MESQRQGITAVTFSTRRITYRSSREEMTVVRSGLSEFLLSLILEKVSSDE